MKRSRKKTEEQLKNNRETREERNGRRREDEEGVGGETMGGKDRERDSKEGEQEDLDLTTRHSGPVSTEVSQREAPHSPSSSSPPPPP